VAEGAFQGFVFDCPDFFGVLADVITDYFDDLIHVLVSLKWSWVCWGLMMTILRRVEQNLWRVDLQHY